MFWPSTAWKAAVLGLNQEPMQIDLSLPYALIGSHLDCQICVQEDGVPELAYLAVAFENEIEVLSLAGNDIGKCGVSDVTKELKVGKTSVQLMLNPVRPNIRNQKVDPPFVLQSRFDGEMISQPPVRQVLFLGVDHPANLRFQNAGLECYDQAMVRTGNSIWLISLRFAFNQQLGNQEKWERVKIFRDSGDSVKVGKIAATLHREDPTSCPPAPLIHEQVVSQVTERLISKSQWQWKRKAAIYTLLGTTLFVASMSIVFWMIAKVIWPMVSEIQG